MKEKLVKKIYKKMNIWEVSACGIPMYPKAHKSYSLVKALTESEEPVLVSEELNKENDSMGEEETKPEGEEEKKPEGEEETPGETESEAKPEETEASDVETTEAKPEEAKSAKTPLISKKVETQLATLINQKVENQMSILMEKAFTQALKESQVPRGFVETEADIQKAMQEKLKDMSAGELAVACGLFKEAPKMGSTLEIK